MKTFFLLWLALQIALTEEGVKTKVIAHRGYWNTANAAQNSLAALKNAVDIGCYGSEFDVLLTKDGVAIVNHDAVIQGVNIEETPYQELKEMKLSNGEYLPTLKEYLKTGKEAGHTRLILEIKPHAVPEREKLAVEKILQEVKTAGLEAKVEYISFSLYVVKEIRRQQPTAIVAYLKGDLSPRQLKGIGCNGLDYHYSVLQKNKHWIKEAHELGLTVNVWTVNKAALMAEMIDSGVDFITTDHPLLLQQLLGTKE